MVVALWTSRLLANTLWTGYVPLALDLTPDVRVLAFTAAVAGLTGVLFGLAPAWRVSRTIRSTGMSGLMVMPNCMLSPLL